ncbi:MAG: SH3 domain-containing protein [Jaaginema sp. PMC 1079.18]|nr:SH3 domain-containing protein [Jaaginema sp. PMC 1080.18]MEC4850590.1 SH3 domain-containing protein [Jaaginema sp. PMC 1079.18]MEC4867078.1 SH3 domain-containing protein [Jaaginema sp. PMC 1078.18]
MNFSRLIQLFLGISIGLLFVVGGAAAAGYYFLSRLAEEPSRPVFAEENPKPETTPSESASTPEAKTEPETATPEPSPAATEAEPEELKENEYRAKVTWPEGLSLRDNPTADAERIGGIAYDKEMIVMAQSEDGNWQKVRLPGSGQEGWVKAGNAEKVE